MINYIEPEDLKSIVKDPSLVPLKDYVIIDVRDLDYQGGHIPGAVNVPAHELMDKTNVLVDDYKDVPLVIFHCALSQVRGPKSARIYNETKNLLRPDSSQQSYKVKVLRGGFEGWHAKFKQDQSLLESYDPAVWQWAT
ncbi:Rhodanese-like protein [Phycomyces nitens]|nr:Rhodanese-like protein [Phycomyces nitens]